MNIKKLVSTTASVVLMTPLMAQIKLKNLDELKEGAKAAADTLQQISMYLNVAGLAIALVFCIYFVATSHPKAKEYVMAIFCALAIYLLAVNVIF